MRSLTTGPPPVPCPHWKVIRLLQRPGARCATMTVPGNRSCYKGWTVRHAWKSRGAPEHGQEVGAVDEGRCSNNQALNAVAAAESFFPFG